MAQEFDRAGGTVNGLPVEFRRLDAEERAIHGVAGPWAYIGFVRGEGPELWKNNGRWREDESPHPLDLAIAVQK